MKAPGGNLLVGIGGYLQLWNWQATDGSPSQPPSPVNFHNLDVAWWKLHRPRCNAPLTYSGCSGSMRRRFVVDDWHLSIRCWWDYEQAPEILFNDGDTLAVKLTIAADATWTGNQVLRSNSLQANPNGSAARAINQQLIGLPSNGLGILPAGQSFLPCYVSPQAVVSLLESNDNSEGSEEDGLVYQDLLIEGDALLWYLNDTEQVSKYADYLIRLMNQNFLALE